MLTTRGGPGGGSSDGPMGADPCLAAEAGRGAQDHAHAETAAFRRKGGGGGQEEEKKGRDEGRDAVSHDVIT